MSHERLPRTALLLPRDAIYTWIQRPTARRSTDGDTILAHRIRCGGQKGHVLYHLDDSIAAVDVRLSADEIAALEEPYVPRAVAGFV